MYDEDFAKNVQQHFPEGLTGIFSIGSSRSSYILEKSQSSSTTGDIENLEDYFNYSVEKLRALMQMFFNLGGKYFILLGIIFPKIDQPGRSKEYQNQIFSGYQTFLNDDMLNFFIENKIDPYFLNLDSWLHPSLPSEVHGLAGQYMQFKNTIPHHTSHNKVIFDLNIQPVYALWNIMDNWDENEYQQFDTQINSIETPEQTMGIIAQFLFEQLLEKSCGIKIPSPHFYLASSSRGTLKWVTSLPSIFSHYHYIKLYFTPYPIFWMQQPSLKRIIEEVILPKMTTSYAVDYRGLYSKEQLQSEYERIKKLAQDPESTLGLSRLFGNN